MTNHSIRIFRLAFIHIAISCHFTALKKSYVDVFNPSGAAPKNDAPILAPMIPTMSTQPNFFVPAAMPNTNQQNVSISNDHFLFDLILISNKIINKQKNKEKNNLLHAY